MNKIPKLLLFIFFPFAVQCQSPFSIEGVFKEKINEPDSVVFLSSDLNSTYYEQDFFKIPIINNKFNIQGQLSYPHLYRIKLTSEAERIPYRSEFYFLDETTSKITIGVDAEGSQNNGVSATEFKQRFEPHILSNVKGDNLNKWLLYRGKDFDSKLQSYVQKFPDSYVALWFLILRFNTDGYSYTKSDILNSFSKKIKSEKLWKEVNNEFEMIEIKEDAIFPTLTLKNLSLEEETFQITKGEFVLIDFWFSRCAPCLEQIPQLKALYYKYRMEGFNIVGISTDVTKNVVPFWKKRVIEKELPWLNLLDENAVVSSKEKIYSFPTNFLVDKNGVVVKKNISLEDLDEFLKSNTTKNPGIFDDRKEF